MRHSLPLLSLILLSIQSLPADEADQGELIFEDKFERAESQEVTDEPGNGWNTNSAKRAGGNKQVDLKDGTLRIFIHETADHGVSVTHPAEFQDGSVGLRFMLEDAKDSIGLNFADLQFKEVHAGHICAARISTNEVRLQDLKTGAMNLKIREARQGDTLTKGQKEMLKTKEAKFTNAVTVGDWHDLLVEIEGDQMAVTIDGEEVGSHRSEGIGHSTKRMLRLAIPRNVVVDDLKIWRKK